MWLSTPTTSFTWQLWKRSLSPECLRINTTSKIWRLCCSNNLRTWSRQGSILSSQWKGLRSWTWFEFQIRNKDRLTLSFAALASCKRMRTSNMSGPLSRLGISMQRSTLCRGQPVVWRTSMEVVFSREREHRRKLRVLSKYSTHSMSLRPVQGSSSLHRIRQGFQGKS